MNLTVWKEKIIERFNKWRDFLRNFWAKMFRHAKAGGIEDPDQDDFGGAMDGQTGGFEDSAEADIGEIVNDGVKGGSKGGGIPVLNGIVVSFRNLFVRNFGSEPGSPGVSKQRIVQYGLGGFIVLFLILLVTALAVNFKKPNTNTVSASAAALSIPSEELFIPAEPDFLPEFLLQREPRSYWSLEDIEPYWKVPSDSDLWREEIKSTVDKIMDGVP